MGWMGCFLDVEGVELTWDGLNQGVLGFGRFLDGGICSGLIYTGREAGFVSVPGVPSLQRALDQNGVLLGGDRGTRRFCVERTGIEVKGLLPT